MGNVLSRQEKTTNALLWVGGAFSLALVLIAFDFATGEGRYANPGLVGAITVASVVFGPPVFLYGWIRNQGHKEAQALAEQRQREGVEERRRQTILPVERVRELAWGKSALPVTETWDGLAWGEVSAVDWRSESVLTGIGQAKGAIVLALLEPKTGLVSHRVVRKGDLAGARLVVNDQTISSATGSDRANTGSVLGRAAVGGILFGGAGAVVGALTGKREVSIEQASHVRVDSVQVLLVFANASVPERSVEFLEMGGSLASSEVQKAIAHAESWHQRLQSLTSVANGAGAMADRLARLAELKAQGLLTESEFAQAKAKVIADL